MLTVAPRSPLDHDAKYDRHPGTSRDQGASHRYGSVQPFHIPRAKPMRKAPEVIGNRVASPEAWLATVGAWEKTR